MSERFPFLVLQAVQASPVHIAELDVNGVHYEVYDAIFHDRLFLTWQYEGFYWSEPEVRNYHDLARLYPHVYNSTDWQPVGIFKIDTGH